MYNVLYMRAEWNKMLYKCDVIFIKYNVVPLFLPFVYIYIKKCYRQSHYFHVNSIDVNGRHFLV